MEHLQLQDSDDNEDSLDFSLTAQAKITKRSKFARKSLSKVRNNLNAHPRKISRRPIHYALSLEATISSFCNHNPLLVITMYIPK